MGKLMSFQVLEVILLVSVFIAIASCLPVVSLPEGNRSANLNASSTTVTPSLVMDPSVFVQVDYYDVMVRRKYGEGFSFNQSCWTYNRTTCLLNAKRNSRSFEEEPTCHPVKQACRFSRPYCLNVQFINPENLNDTWLNGLSDSGCAPANSSLKAGYNEGFCKYTRYANTEKIMSWGWCAGDYCNYWPQEVAHPEDEESKEAYVGFVTVDKITVIRNSPSPSPEDDGDTSSRDTSNQLTTNMTLIVAVGCVLAVTVTLIISLVLCLKYSWYRTCIQMYKYVASNYASSDSETKSSEEEIGLETPEVSDDLHINLKSLVLHNQGRFGKVYLLDTPYHDYKAVVKVYMAKDKKFWDQERQVFSQPHMADHENIVRFLGPVCLGDDFAIILEFYSTNLTSYLKGHTLKWTEMMTIMQSMMKGYSHLHSCYTIPEDLSCKIPIVHRDVKSNNIMLDSNLTAKICDFNLSLVLEKNLIEMEKMSLPGTTRYMAPELLGSHMIRSREGLLQTDVYSIALILWEILSRYEKYKTASKTYRPPYDEYVGSNPAVKDMYEVVCVQKRRPYLAPQYHPAMEELLETIKDSWDDDGEMRLTSAGIESRIDELFKQYPHQAPSLSEVTNTDSVELNNRNNING